MVCEPSGQGQGGPWFPSVLVLAASLSRCLVSTYAQEIALPQPNQVAQIFEPLAKVLGQNKSRIQYQSVHESIEDTAIIELMA